MPSDRVFKKEVEVLKGKMKDKFMEIYRENLSPCDSFTSPTFLNKAASQYAFDHPECCEIILVNNRVWDKSIIKDISAVLSNSLESQSMDADNADYRGLTGAKSDLLGNLFINNYKFSYNPTPHSCINSVKYQSDSGQFNYRLEFKLTTLSSPSNHMVESYVLDKNGEILEDNERKYKYAITDECLLLAEELKEFRGIEGFCKNYSDYTVVINLGVMTKESFNYHLKEDKFTVFNKNKCKGILSKEVYAELIPIWLYNKDYSWKMTSPLHFLNCIGNLSFLRLMCGSLGHLFQAIENSDKYKGLISSESMPSLTNLFEITRNRLKGSSNFYYTVGQGDSMEPISKMTFRLMTSYNEKQTDGKLHSFIYFTDVTVEKKNISEQEKKERREKKDNNSVKTVPIVSFTKAIIKEIPNFSECDDDAKEDFIRYYFSSLPIIGYGNRGLLGQVLKKLNRDCISAYEIERTIYYLDLDDILTAFSMLENEKLNKKYKKKTNSPFFFNNSCVDMIDIFSDSLLKSSPIRTSRLELRKELQTLQNNIYRYINENKLQNNDIVALLPLLYVFYISVCLLTSKGLVTSILERISFFYPTKLKGPLGDYDYNEKILNYCSGGFLTNIEEGKKIDKEKIPYKHYMYLSSDFMDGIENFSFNIEDKDNRDTNNNFNEEENKDNSSFNAHLFGLTVEDFEKSKENVEISDLDLDFSFNDILEHAKDSFNETLSQSTVDFCDKVDTDTSNKCGNDLEYCSFVDDGPIDIKEMKSFSILEENTKSNISEAELASYANPEGSPMIDFSKDDEVGFGESTDIPNLPLEMENWTLHAEEIEDIIEDTEETFILDDSSIEPITEVENTVKVVENKPLAYSLLDKENKFTDAQIRLFLKNGIISISDIKNFIISKINTELYDIDSLLNILREL